MMSSSNRIPVWQPPPRLCKGRRLELHQRIDEPRYGRAALVCVIAALVCFVVGAIATVLGP